MKKLKKLTLNKIDFHPDHRLPYGQMGDIQGGAGCICWNNPFNINGTCACDDNPFGLCNEVQGKPPYCGSWDGGYD